MLELELVNHYGVFEKIWRCSAEMITLIQQLASGSTENMPVALLS